MYFKKRNLGVKTAAWVLTAAMVFSSCPLTVYAEEEDVVSQDAKQTVTKVCPTIGNDGEVTFHYYPEDGKEVSEVYAKGSWDSNWGVYYNLEKDENGVWSKTVQLSLDKSFEYGLMVDGEWVGDPTNTRVGGNSQILRNPTTNSDGSVTIFYYPNGNEEVEVLYKTSDEDYKSITMSKDEYHPALLSATITEPGSYTYKLKVNGQETDDKNTSNASFSIAGEQLEDDENVKSPVINDNSVTFNYFAPHAKEVKLAGSMTNWGSDAKNLSYNENTGFWSITVELEAGKYEYKFIADGNWTTDPKNDSYSNGNSAFEIVAASEDVDDDKKDDEDDKTEGYNYTIYYLDSTHNTKDSASLWIWTDGQDGNQYYFDEAVTLEDGQIWLKANVNLDFTKLNIIPRAYSDWSWQDSDKNYDNENSEKNSTIYLVNADSKVYTEIPEVTKKEQRYVIIEYTRENNDYDNWEIYTWNSGYGSAVVVGFEQVNGKMVAMVPVTATKENISFCMKRSEDGNAWAEKDGGDHDVQIPLNQSIVKAQFIQDQGIVGHTEYNLGYETNVDEAKVYFYYRDDTLFKEYKESELVNKVSLIYDGKELEMNYDSDDERFYVECDLESGNHYYGYMVDGELVLDKYNESTTDIDGKTYSSFKYEKADITINAKLSKNTINYNENAVLYIETEAENIAEVKADLSALGQSANFEIDTNLMAGTIAVKEGTSLGEKIIPITVKDSYGNKYDTSVTIKVVERDKTNDFDWDEAVIYFAVTDRFFDGNSENNDAYGTGSYDLSQGSLFHGGDFAGLNEKLDYLKELGVNTIWITPIVENTSTVSVASSNYPDQKTSAYHGYWAQDFTKLDAHLGTEEEFSALLSAAHSKGMKIMVDVVLNHAGYGTESTFGDMVRNTSNTIKGDDKKDGLSGLPDFVTENSEVRDLLVEWQSNWISKYDIDYYRVDTVKHVDDTTWKAFKNALTIIDPEFKMIGEYAGAGYKSNVGQLGTGQMDALLDFDFNDKALDFVTGNITSVESFLEDRNANIDNTAMMGSFLGSHDEDGFKYRLINERKVSKENAEALSKVAAALQITAKGQPVIYYGEEIGQTGANNWPYQENRYDFDWSKVDESNETLVHYEKMLEIRNAYTEVFAKGTRTTVATDDSNKAIVFERSYNGSSVYVGLNTNVNSEAEITVSGLKANTSYTDLYNDVAYTSDGNGEVVLAIPSAKDGGVAVLAVSEADNNNNTSFTDIINSIIEANTTQTTAVTSVVEPTYKKADGTTVTGWSNVTKAALADTLAKINSANADAYIAGDQTPVVTITVDKNATKKIPASVVKEMIKSGATYKFVLKDDVVITFDEKTLSKINGALELESTIFTTDKFGQGFKGLVISPYITLATDEGVNVTVNLGVENAGKPVYVFTRKANETVYFRKIVGFISKDGSFEIEGVDLENLVVLY